MVRFSISLRSLCNVKLSETLNLRFVSQWRHSTINSSSTNLVTTFLLEAINEAAHRRHINLFNFGSLQLLLPIKWGSLQFQHGLFHCDATGGKVMTLETERDKCRCLVQEVYSWCAVLNCLGELFFLGHGEWGGEEAQKISSPHSVLQCGRGHSFLDEAQVAAMVGVTPGSANICSLSSFSVEINK